MPHEPIAIVGIGCRFPGADGPDAFWRLLETGGDAIREIPSDRLPVDRLYDPRPSTPGRMMTRWAGLVEGLDRFDAAFFGISPREADRLDPQQRLLLETAWEAMEDAGLARERLHGCRGGVFVGLWLNEYESRMYRDPDRIDFHMTTGTGRYSASGRLSYVFGLRGPSVTVDCACSSSLVAVHLACQSLWTGECDIALAGGANAILEPSITIAYSQSRMMAPDGRCKFGDARADGYVRSDGAGLVVLEPLSRAEANGDPIHAVILGSAVNNDGGSSGSFGTPSRSGQEDLLRAAYRHAGVAPGGVHYIEAHGTGTRAGDPVEIGALAAVLGDGREAGRPLLVGSVKTNIGHTEGAAGVAGLIKTALSLENRLIPRSLHFEQPNPDIPWAELPLSIPREAQALPGDGAPATAGVSSFGIAGTNAHVVLGQYRSARSSPTPEAGRPAVLALSAATPEALRALADRTFGSLREATPDAAAIADLCYSSTVRRSHLRHRLACVGATHEGIAECLEAYLAGESRPGLCAPGVSAPAAQAPVSSRSRGRGRPPEWRIVFVFPGQGSQWPGMGCRLLETQPAFAAEMRACDAAIARTAGWSLLSEIQARAERSRLEQIAFVQPALFAMEVSLAALWRSWGVRPDAVIGHSMGEVAAAYVAGALPLDAAVRVICRRSELLQRIAGRGAMAVVGLSLAAARDAVARFEGRLSVAVSNSSESTVLSGDPEALDQLLPALEGRQVFCRRVKVDVASHSPQVEPLLEPLADALSDLRPSPAAVPFVSTVFGAVVPGEELGPEYWTRNLREPVLFSAGVERLIEGGCDAFVEMSPHPLLLAPIEQETRRLGVTVATVPSLRRDEDESATILESLGRYWVAELPLDWSGVFPERRRVTPLPSYPWQRERAWYEAPDASGGGRRPTAARLLTARPTRSAVDAGTSFWETDLSLDALPELADHRVRGDAVLPAACLAELAFEAAEETLGAPVRLEDLQLERFIALPADAAMTLQVVVTDEGGGRATFSISSREDAAASGAGWTTHAQGRAIVDEGDGRAHPETAAARYAMVAMDAAGHYRSMADRGLAYGPAFRGVTEVRHAGERVFARLVRPDVLPAGDGWKLRSILFDSALQGVLAALDVLPAGRWHSGTFVPVAIASLSSLAPLDGANALWAEVTLREVTPEQATADLVVVDDEGQDRLRVGGVVFRRLPAGMRGQPSDLSFEVAWEPAPLHAAADASGTARQWVVFEDGLGVADALVPRLEARGAACVRVARSERERGDERESLAAAPGDFDRALSRAVTAAQGRRLGLVYLWALDVPPAAGGEPDWVIRSEAFSVTAPLRLLQAVARLGLDTARVWIVTCDAQACTDGDSCGGFGASPVWGLASAVAAEFPALQCTVVDLSGAVPAADVPRLVEELLADSIETRVALRAEARLVARLARCTSGSAERPAAVTRVPGGKPFRVEIGTAGVLDALLARERPRTAPGEGSVEIEVRATGLNFMNVLSAMGLYPGYAGGVGPLGIECSGVVTCVGCGVTDLAVGDEVMGVAFDCLASHAVTDARLLVRKPSGLSFAEAATIPVAYMTAHYALNHLGHMEEGERLLVHSAAGGVGLAAMRLARLSGVEVLATAGSAAKREWLRASGATFTADSHALSFADEVMAFTNGEGVDLVLNSLAGPAIERGLATLRAHGRFLEIGKRDIYANTRVGLSPFRRSLSYFAIDLDRTCRERPGLGGRLLREVAALLDRGAIAALPFRVFPVSAAADAFREMAQGGHTGKLVIEMAAEHLTLQPRRLGDGTWLVTGGMGALGLAVSHALAARGVRSLVLLGRGAPSDSAREVIEGLERQGVRVTIRSGDVSRLDDVRAAIEAVPDEHPLTGVVHAAGVLDDALLLEQDEERVARVLGPKLRGAWNLHVATAGRTLEHFVLFSSVAAFLGLAGQANYAAANAFLDGLAAARRRAGQPATSIAWGPWARVGLAAARSDRGERLAARGLASISVEQGLDAFLDLLDRTPVNRAVMAFDARQWREATPGLSGFLSRLTAEGASGGAPASGGLRENLMALPAASRIGALEQHICEGVGQVLRMAPSRVDRTRPFRALGLDSLMAVELRNRLEASTAAQLPATLAWNYPTVTALAPLLAERMGVPLADGEAVPAPLDDTPPAGSDHRVDMDGLLDEIATLSDDDVRRLLAEE